MRPVILISLLAGAVAATNADDAERRPMAQQALLLLKEALPYQPAAEEPTTRNADADMSPILVLPKVIVQQSRSPKIDADKLLSATGLAAKLAKLYPGTTLHGAPTDYTQQSRHDRERLEHMDELSSFANMLRSVGDVSGSKDLTKLVDSTFVRQRDSKTDMIDKWVNGNRR